MFFAVYERIDSLAFVVTLTSVPNTAQIRFLSCVVFTRPKKTKALRGWYVRVQALWPYVVVSCVREDTTRDDCFAFFRL